MPKRVEKLTAVNVADLARNKKPGTYPVGGVPGLRLQVGKEKQPDGTYQRSGWSSWILRIQVGDRRRHYGLGPYPDVTLKQARERAQEYKGKVAQGVDPIIERREAKQALIHADAKRLTFAEAAQCKFDLVAEKFTSTKVRAEWLRSLERHAYPVIGDLPVADIGTDHVRRVLLPIWDKAEASKKVRQRLKATLDWATTAGLRDGPNPAVWDDVMENLMPARAKRERKHHAALPWADVPDFMARLRQRGGNAAKALDFAILTAARSGEVRGARWDEIDFDARMWRVPAERMKARRTHDVPLSDDAVKLLRGQPRTGALIFPSRNGGALSDMALSSVTRKMGDPVVPHGFRSSFKDWCSDRQPLVKDDASEIALAHRPPGGPTRDAYARASLAAQRTRLMQVWAQHCRGAAYPMLYAEMSAERAEVVNMAEARG